MSLGSSIRPTTLLSTPVPVASPAPTAGVVAGTSSTISNSGPDASNVSGGDSSNPAANAAAAAAADTPSNRLISQLLLNLKNDVSLLQSRIDTLASTLLSVTNSLVGVSTALSKCLSEQVVFLSKSNVLPEAPVSPPTLVSDSSPPIASFPPNPFLMHDLDIFDDSFSQTLPHTTLAVIPTLPTNIFKEEDSNLAFDNYMDISSIDWDTPLPMPCSTSSSSSTELVQATIQNYSSPSLDNIPHSVHILNRYQQEMVRILDMSTKIHPTAASPTLKVGFKKTNQLEQIKSSLKKRKYKFQETDSQETEPTQKIKRKN